MDNNEKLEVTVLEKNAIILFNDEIVKNNGALAQVFDSMKAAFPDLKFVAVPHSIVSGISTFTINEPNNTVIQVRSDKVTRDEKRRIIKHLRNVYPGIEIVFTNSDTKIIPKDK